MKKMNDIIEKIFDFKNYTWEDYALWVAVFALIGAIIVIAADVGAF